MFYISGHMDIGQATAALGALSQETRLQVFRILVKHGQAGAPAGTLSEALGIPHNTLSFHLSHNEQCRACASAPRRTIHHLQR